MLTRYAPLLLLFFVLAACDKDPDNNTGPGSGANHCDKNALTLTKPGATMWVDGQSYTTHNMVPDTNMFSYWNFMSDSNAVGIMYQDNDSSHQVLVKNNYGQAIIQIKRDSLVAGSYNLDSLVQEGNTTTYVYVNTANLIPKGNTFFDSFTSAISAGSACRYLQLHEVSNTHIKGKYHSVMSKITTSTPETKEMTLEFWVNR